jgi:hypothetical protein
MTDLRLNLGCGLNAVESWKNLDRSPNFPLDRMPVAKRVLRRLGVLSDAHMTAWPRNVTRFDIRRRLTNSVTNSPFGRRAMPPMALKSTFNIIG